MSQTLNLETLIENYQDDYRYLIYQVSARDYESVINSFLVLSELFCLIQRLEKLENCWVDVPPPTLLADPAIIEKFHIEPNERHHLHDFLNYIEYKKGISFEQLVSQHMREYKAYHGLDATS
ncbi:MAG: hypothetical protein AB1489_10980 [Acidobacteriota bacterium]